MDDKQRIALVETRTDRATILRRRNSSATSSATTSARPAWSWTTQAQIISYEEYYPYGSTSYQAVRSQTETPKRYRYTGKERDEESGLYYHGARYYAPWLGRWTSCDPIGIEDGVNVYAYVRNNPVVKIDRSGKQTEPIQKQKVVDKDGDPVNKKIVIDAGHGGDDPGTTKKTGKRDEKDITLKVVLAIKQRLSELNTKYKENVDVTSTREEDKNPGGKGQKASLKERVKISKEAKTDLFISVHVDAAGSETADKVSIYRKINANDASKTLSANITKALKGVATTTKGVVEKEASHHVTREQESNVGGVLVEIGYITIPTQEALFNDDAYLQKLGNALGDAIFNTAYPTPTEKITDLLLISPTPALVPDALYVKPCPDERSAQGSS